MAARANRAARWCLLWHQLIEPSSQRLIFAARLALICTVVSIVAEVYQTPEIALTIYIAFFMNKPDRVSSIALATGFTIITTLVVALLVVIAPPLLAQPGLRMLAMTAISFAIMFLASASKLKPLAPTVGLVFAYALDLLGAVPFGEAATRALLYAWLFVGIPALVSVIVNLLIAPAPRSLVEKNIAEALRLLAQIVTAASSPASANNMRKVWQGDEALQGQLKLAGIERTSRSEDMRALKAAADSLVTLRSAVQLMLDEPGALPSPRVRQTIANRLCEAASAFEAAGYPAGIAAVHPDGDAPALALSAIAILNRGLAGFGEVPPVKAKEKSGFFEPDAFQNVTHVRFALKVTGAAMLCYLLYTMLNWPGIHTALITCFIVSLGTTAESVEKLSLRIGGCLAGAALGIVVMLRVIPHVTDIGSLAILVSTGTFLGAWVAGGDKHISYAGFQIAFAYLLCVVQGPSPMFDMVVARDRVIGILIGNVVSYLVATYIWPVSVSGRIAATSTSSWHSLLRMADAGDLWARRRAAAENRKTLDDLAGDILLASYEPARIRPRRAWLAAQQRANHATRKLNEVLLDWLEIIPQGSTGALQAILAGDLLLEGAPLTIPSEDRQLESLLRSRTAALYAARAAIDEVANHD